MLEVGRHCLQKLLLPDVRHGEDDGCACIALQLMFDNLDGVTDGLLLFETKVRRPGMESELLCSVK